MARTKTKQPVQDPIKKASSLKSNSLKIKIENLVVIDPLTTNQKAFFDIYKRGASCIALTGSAGTGKTFIAIYKALEQVLDPSNEFERLVIVRSATPSREIGHTPGTVEEKMANYEMPYFQICSELLQRKDAYSRLTEQDHIKFISTSFIRGITLDNSIIVVDELQNLNFDELDTIITRVGYNSRIIFCGDYRQTDLKKSNDKSGFKKFISVANTMKSFAQVDFTAEDIVRSGLVKEYILARNKFEDMEG